jgi:hypothetical protein
MITSDVQIINMRIPSIILIHINSVSVNLVVLYRLSRVPVIQSSAVPVIHNSVVPVIRSSVVPVIQSSVVPVIRSSVVPVAVFDRFRFHVPSC